MNELENKFMYSGNYTQRCCLKPGKHTLTCYTTDESLGWEGAKITIDGHIFCDDFITYRAMREIIVTGI